MKMPYWREIKNHVELADQLRTMIENAVIECCSYDRDLYLYIDKETGDGSLTWFENVGGRSWIDDDHITIYTDKEHHETMYDACTEIGDFADVLEIRYDDLIQTCREWYAHKHDMDVEDIADEDINWNDVVDMIDGNCDLSDKYQEWYEEYVRDDLSEYINDQVCEIIEGYDEMVDRAYDEEEHYE